MSCGHYAVLAVTCHSYVTWMLINLCAPWKIKHNGGNI